MALGFWPAVNCSHRGDMLAVLCSCVNSGLLAELVQSKLECSEKPFRLLDSLSLPSDTQDCMPPFHHQAPLLLGFHSQGGQRHLNVRDGE